MKRKNLTLIFKNFEREHLGKDVFLVPYYLGKMNNMNVKIVCPKTDTNETLGSTIDGVEVVRISTKKVNSDTYYYDRNVLLYLLRNAARIDVLCCIHVRWQIFIIVCLYRIINPKGFIYCKADGSVNRWWNNKRFSRQNLFFSSFIKTANIISIETREIFDRISQMKPTLKNKIRFVPNGFDEEKLKTFNITEKSIKEKDNIIITVARLGSYPKNTEMILQAAEMIDFKNWKLLLIGPIEMKEQNFQEKIDLFYEKNSKLKDKVIFTGPIYDKKELWEYYNQSKVFILTSIYEGFAIVFGEAYRFSNYILTTNVGGAPDSIIGGYGSIFNDLPEFVSKLQSIIDGEVDIEKVYHTSDRRNISWEKLLQEIEQNK